MKKYRMISFPEPSPFFPDEVDAMMGAEHVFIDEHKCDRDMVKVDVASVPGVRTFKHKRHLWFFRDQFEPIGGGQR